MAEDFYTSIKQNDDLDIGKVFRFILMQSKLVLLIVLFVFSFSYISYSLSTKEYLIKSLIQYESFNQNVFDPSNTLRSSSPRSYADISNLIQLYESRTNYLKVINDLKLNIDIKNLKNEEEIDIIINTDKKNEFLRHELKFLFSQNTYTLLDDNLDVIQKSDYGESIQYNDLTIIVNSVNLKEYRHVDIEFQHPESMFNALKSMINVDTISSRNTYYSNESLITVSLVSDDIEQGKKIINYANNIFLNQRIYDENEKSRKAINFIDSTITSLENTVQANKIKLKEFREKNKSIDVGLEIEAIINKIQFLDESLNSIDIEISKAQEIYTPNNPAYLNILDKKKLIEKQKEVVLFEIENMPKEQQEYIDLYNDVESSQELFEELESRRLGFSILEASTIGDIKIVDDAYLVTLVSPKIITVFTYSVVAFILACIIAIIRGFHFLPISNPAEIFDNNIHLPILGVIPQIDDSSSSDDYRLNSSIESLIVNISSAQSNNHDKNLITITSPTPMNGKSTISMKLAEGLARVGKKVALVDNDLKRGKIARSYGLNSISEKTFNSIDDSTINNYKINDYLYIIPRVKGLNNTFQFLYNYAYKEKIKFFKDNFDYVIFDTGPILSVADSSILIEQSDLNLLIIRHEINKINEIKQSIDNYKQINKSIDGIVYNAYSKPKSYYGYYGIYGNYSYQYYAEKYLDESYEYKPD